MIDSQSTVDSRLLLRRQLNWLAVETVMLAVCFSRPLIDLLRLAYHSQLFSYIPLIPVITAYLIWTDRKKMTAEVSPSGPAPLWHSLWEGRSWRPGGWELAPAGNAPPKITWR